MSSIYCERFAQMIRDYAETQHEFAELTHIPDFALSRMKQSEGMLGAHLIDIAKALPSFDFNYLMHGDTTLKSDNRKKIRTLAKKIVTLCQE